MPRPGTTQINRAAREERLRCIARDLLAESGIKQSDLAARYGVTQQQISKDIKTIHQRYREEAVADTTPRIGRQLAVYRALIDTHLPRAMNGNARSADICLGALAGESKLMGMDRPVRQEMAVDNSVRVEIVGVADEDIV